MVGYLLHKLLVFFLLIFKLISTFNHICNQVFLYVIFLALSIFVNTVQSIIYTEITLKVTAYR